jgi:glyoxylase-like metal-dependent hydrolase (beta-lactamase superfamily II)
LDWQDEKFIFFERGTTMKVWSILGNTQKLDGGAMFGNAPKAVWQKWYPPDEHSRIHLACRSMLVEIDNKKVLLETGIGSFFEPKLKKRFGVVEDEHILLKNLQEIGLSHENIDCVILSHLHFDHAGGLLSSYEDGKNPKLLFPNAQFVVGKQALARAKAPHKRDRASFIPELPNLLENSGKLLIVDERASSHKDVFPDTIEFIYSDGHTPGQMHALVHGSKQSLFFAGDLIPGKAWVHLPITMGYDRYPEKVIDEKESLYSRLIDQDITLFFTHDIEFSSAKIKQNEKGRFETTNENAEIVGLEI